jgi:hypothetical protein
VGRNSRAQCRAERIFRYSLGFRVSCLVFVVWCLVFGGLVYCTESSSKHGVGAVYGCRCSLGGQGVEC